MSELEGQNAPQQNLVSTPKTAPQTVEISAEESLGLRNEETNFLRAQIQIKDLQAQIRECSQKAEAASRAYNAKLDEIIGTHEIDKKFYTFDNLSNTFKSALIPK